MPQKMVAAAGMKKIQDLQEPGSRAVIILFPVKKNYPAVAGSGAGACGTL